MSLQVWLPLTGSLVNQGLSDITVSGGILTTGGKFGQCYAANSSNRLVITHNLATTSEFTLSFWMKMPSTMANNTAWETMITYPAIVSAGATTGSTNISWASYHNIKIYDDSNHQWLWIGPGDIFKYDEWQLWTITHTAYSEGVECKIYINGNLINTYRNASQPLQIRAGSIYFGYGITTDRLYFNDIRVYNHCLSVKEVHELSKALVLHYKLDDPFIEATTNLITTADPLSSTCYNGATNKYGYGANTDIYKETTTWEGQTGTKVHMGTNGLAANPYVYFSNLYTSNGTNSPAYKTISFDYYATRGTWLNIYKLGSGSGTCNWRNVTTGQSGSYTNSANAIVVMPNHWNHIEATFHGTTDADAQWGYCILGGQHTSDTNNFWFFANVQIETRDHATPYVGGPGITRAASLTAYDSSGYGYNGTLVSGRNLSVLSDAPRYTASTMFPFTSSQTGNYITMDNANFFSALSNCTITWWGKYNAAKSLLLTGQTTSHYLAAGNTGFYNGTCTLTKWYTDGLAQGTPSYVANQWHFYAFTGTLNSWTKLMLNNYGGGDTWSINGQISDFRIYNTTLSDADILELYHTEAAVGRGGEVFAREVIER